MALYKNPSYLLQSNHALFDQLYRPGAVTPHSGIYRCMSCGDEVACNRGNPLPPQNHRQHNPANGAISWRLIVLSVQQP